MAKSSGTGKTKGKTKAVKPLKYREPGGSKLPPPPKRGTNPLAILILLPLVLAIGGFLGWYYYQNGHLPLFVTEEQRQTTLDNAKKTWADIQQTTLDKWKTTKDQLAQLDKKFSSEYDAYIKNRDRKQRETEAFMQQMEAPPPKPTHAILPPSRLEPVRIAPKPLPPPVVAAPVTAPTPTPVQPGADAATAKPPAPTPPENTATPAPNPNPPPVDPPAAPKYNPQEDTNYKNGVKKYDAAFQVSQKADAADGDEAIGNYKEAIALISAAQASWQLVADKAMHEGVSTDPFVASINNCKANAKIWQENIDNLKKAAEAPPPAATADTGNGGSAAMSGSGGGNFYASHPKWNEGKQHFKEGYDIFTKNVGSNTGQSSQVLNRYIDQAVDKFNKAQECWDKAEEDWNKKYPNNSGPKSDLDMMDKAQSEAQFYRYACMKMHTF